LKAKHVMMDGNQAAAHVAYRINELIAVYPITPSSAMGEWADEWSTSGVPNVWGTVPTVVEMQSEGGAAGAVHGCLQGGALTTTFTASQGLLLMLPNMFKIAGELTPAVFHIAARAVAGQALSIFGDHSDVMAARTTGWGMLFSASVQEAHDLALVAQAASLESRVPFLHAFDGFRTSHELNRIELLPDEVMRAMIDTGAVAAHRARRLTPDAPVIRGTAQNPDTFFQAREAANPFYAAAPAAVGAAMDRFADLTGRRYRPYEYAGDPEAQAVVVLMGSGAQTAEATAAHLNRDGAKVGVLNVRLFRPLDARALVAALPASAMRLAVLDRTKEPGAAGEPLYQDVVTALAEACSEGRIESVPEVIGGRYGLSSKEFTPAMVRAVFDELGAPGRRNHFTVGIRDDVSNTSLDWDPSFVLEDSDAVRAIFWGRGGDGTVGANKNSAKIIGEDADLAAQAYFVYDSRKSGAYTVSHVRFGPNEFRSPYLIQRASFIACHQYDYLTRFDVLEPAEQGATVLLNSHRGPVKTWLHLPERVRQQIVERDLAVWVIDANAVARRVGLGGRINTVMQACFFALSGVLPRDEAMTRVKAAIEKSYAKAGREVVERNFAAVDAALDGLARIEIGAAPEAAGSDGDAAVSNGVPVPGGAPDFVREVLGAMIAGRGDELPVSALPVDGTYPTGTTRWEKRNIADEVPVWESSLCIQCGKCVVVCPHAAIRSKVVPAEALAGAPAGFDSLEAKFKELPDQRYVLQVSAEDCTGCRLCYEVCPAHDREVEGRRALNMSPQRPLRQSAREQWPFFLELPDVDRHDGLKFSTVRNVQLLEPLFEFSSACTGCGETPYIRLLTQLLGDRLIVANATGCSSIYGGNMPTTPWAKNAAGRGPAWSNSLFEDNAEFGLGLRLAADKQAATARRLVGALAGQLGDGLAESILGAPQATEADIDAQRERVAALRRRLRESDAPDARRLEEIADALVRKSVWLVGGDGWAYDIGYGGLDHVLASGHDVKALVLDTEVYSNTGGQASKATPLGAIAKFAAGGKATGKKDLGRMAMVYGHVYVAQVAMGANDGQALRAMQEAESYPGPALVIAFSPCIAHGIEMGRTLDQAKQAVASGAWPLYRFDPRREAIGKPPLQLDCKAPAMPFKDYAMTQSRFRRLARRDGEAAEAALAAAQADVDRRWRALSALAEQAPAAAAD